LISVSFFSRRFAPASETTRGRSRPALQVPIGRRVGWIGVPRGRGIRPIRVRHGPLVRRPRAILIIGQPCRRRRRPDRRRPIPSTDRSTWTENLRGPGTARNSHGCDSDHSGDGVPQGHLQTCRSTRASRPIAAARSRAIEQRRKIGTRPGFRTRPVRWPQGLAAFGWAPTRLPRAAASPQPKQYAHCRFAQNKSPKQSYALGALLRLRQLQASRLSGTRCRGVGGGAALLACYRTSLTSRGHLL
jgi:hypothetical protein